MLFETVPGTVLPGAQFPGGVAEVFEGMLQVAGGLSLSQVCAITGLEPSTVQNWVKRGWVANPQEKKYRQRQLFRILILNALRDAMQLEQIVRLLAYLNGSVEDHRDDIICESRLFEYLCRALETLKEYRELTDGAVERAVKQVSADYTGDPAWRQRLEKGLAVMVWTCAAALLRKKGEGLCRALLEE